MRELISKTSKLHSVVASNVTGTGLEVVGELGQPGILIDNVEKACASSSTAVRIATWVVGAGLYDVVLCVGVEKMARGSSGYPGRISSWLFSVDGYGHHAGVYA